MKKPNIKDLATVQPEDDFSKAVEKEKSGGGVVAKTYTIEQRHVDHINGLAAELSMQQGKPVNASTALRSILTRDIDRS